jgi:hypothetical protein
VRKAKIANFGSRVMKKAGSLFQQPARVRYGLILVSISDYALAIVFEYCIAADHLGVTCQSGAPGGLE